MTQVRSSTKNWWVHLKLSNKCVNYSIAFFCGAVRFGPAASGEGGAWVEEWLLSNAIHTNQSSIMRTRSRPIRALRPQEAPPLAARITVFWWRLVDAIEERSVARSYTRARASSSCPLLSSQHVSLNSAGCLLTWPHRYRPPELLNRIHRLSRPCPLPPPQALFFGLLILCVLEFYSLCPRSWLMFDSNFFWSTNEHRQ